MVSRGEQYQYFPSYDFPGGSEGGEGDQDPLSPLWTPPPHGFLATSRPSIHHLYHVYYLWILVQVWIETRKFRANSLTIHTNAHRLSFWKKKLFRFAKQDYHNGALIIVTPALDRPSLFFQINLHTRTKQTTCMHGASGEDSDQPDYLSSLIMRIRCALNSICTHV